MKTALILFFALLLLTQASASERAYVLNIHYFEGELELNDVYVDVLAVQESLEEEPGLYKASVKSFGGEELLSHFFKINRSLLVDNPDENTGSVVELDDLNFALILPHFSEGKGLDITGPEGSTLLSVDLAPFADVCGDGECQQHENSEECPADCEEKEIAFSLAACTDSECSEVKEEFTVGKKGFVGFESEEPGITVSALVVSPDASEATVQLPEVIEFSQEGTYIIEATASKPGFEDSTEIIALTAVEAAKETPPLQQEAVQGLPPEYLAGIAAVVIIIIAAAVFFLKIKK